MNFRSHTKILELANSVINLIEIFFPKTIDRMRKEKSNIDGPKPVLVLNDLELLLMVLLGKEKYSYQSLSSIQFGCNQVIIVRNQESKSRVPKIFQHTLCLTVYEAKVIFSFFFQHSK